MRRDEDFARVTEAGLLYACLALRLPLDEERQAGVEQSCFGDPGEILVAPHQTALPGVFELLGAPELTQSRAFPRPQLLAQRDHRMHIEERAVGVEHDRAQRRQRFLQGTWVTTRVYSRACNRPTPSRRQRAFLGRSRGSAWCFWG